MKIGITSFILLFIITACGSDSSEIVTTAPELTSERLTIDGAGDLGIFDPSISQDPDTGRLWMSYSSVDTSSYYDSSLYWGVSIRLAFSDDNGTSWEDAGSPLSSNVEMLVGPMTESHPTQDIPVDSQGIWQSETSSLIYDPSADVSERWKLIWHQYLNANLTSYFADYSWIAMKSASTPMALTSATTVKLFGGVGLQPDNSITGTPVFSPADGVPAVQLNSAITQSVGGANLSELDFCIFAEPGLHATDSAVYLTVYCADASTIPVSGEITEYLVHFRCNSPCSMTSASSWEYLGRLLTSADALAATGDHHFQAPSLLEKNGKTYLIVTSVDRVQTQDLYNGCRVYEFVDINTNQLVRDNAGVLVEVVSAEGEPGSHHGACATFAGLDGGLYLSQLGTVGIPGMFSIYKSQIALP